MTSETIFRLLTFTFLAIALGVSINFRHRAEREGGELDKTEGQPLLLLLRLMGLIVILPLFGYLLNPAWVDWARIPLQEWVRWSGAVVAAIMLLGLYWMFRTLGTNISPTQMTRSDHKLITVGPYRWIRHPLYTFGLLFFLAIATMTGLWWLAASMLIPFAILVWRVQHEEAYLLAKFGDQYRAYMQQTGRFIPRMF